MLRTVPRHWRGLPLAVAAGQEESGSLSCVMKTGKPKPGKTKPGKKKPGNVKNLGLL